MGNNEIGARKQAFDAKVSAQRNLEKIREREKKMNKEVVFEELNGKIVVRERFTSKTK